MAETAPSVAIVDYGMGNLFSVEQACHSVGLKTITTNDPEQALSTSGLIVPGVGAYADAMEALRKRGLTNAIESAAKAGKPIMGICLGMQVLFDESHEFGICRGMGLIEGRVVRIPSEMAGKKLKVPQVGWHSVSHPQGNEDETWEGTPLRRIRPGAYMHFVHSFYAEPANKDVVVAQTTYGEFTFCSAVASGAIFACQFHPERSGPTGIRIYENFKSQVVGCYAGS